MTEAAWAEVQQLLDSTGAPDEVRFAVAVGCPVHGNASMDWDDDGAFCQTCEAKVDPYPSGLPAAR